MKTSLNFDYGVELPIEKFIKDKEKYKNIFFYGASITCEGALKIFKKYGFFMPKVITDSNSNLWGTEIDGIPIVSPTEAYEKYSDFYVFMAIGKHLFEVKDELLKHFSSDKLVYFREEEYLDKNKYRAYLQTNIDELNSIYNTLEDEKSKETYKNLLTARNNGCLDLYVDVFTTPQYFQEDIYKFNEDDIFLDIGAFTGDTIEEYVKLTNGKYKKIIAFEPCEKFYKNILKLQEKYDNIELVKKGASNKQDVLEFNDNVSGYFVDSNMSEGVIGYFEQQNMLSTQIEVDKIDNLLNGEKVTIIKMDIEGYEMNALEGAVKTIKQNKPTLAICIYHKFTDFIDIPKFILDLNLGYKLYLRHHDTTLSESVLYAVIDD